jgi:hypothetical protein
MSPIGVAKCDEYMLTLKKSDVPKIEKKIFAYS